MYISIEMYSFDFHETIGIVLQLIFFTQQISWSCVCASILWSVRDGCVMGVMGAAVKNECIMLSYWWVELLPIFLCYEVAVKTFLHDLPWTQMNVCLE